jgi:inhibitor of cysteine peptidase
MEDKFIMMGMDDERSKYVAEVLKSKTAKKILDFLAETKEASEKDLSSALEIPINTIEYNLNKLKKAGLVVKSKNFFWSRKGKKIAMYKLAKKHIIISPKMKSPSTTLLKALLPVLGVLVLALVIVSMFPSTPQNQFTIEDDSVKYFSSYSEMKDFLKENSDTGRFYGGFGGMLMVDGLPEGAVSTTGAASATPKNSATDFSSTNIQVEGVDEPDIVKNDGKYIYTVSGKKVLIINAYPAEEMDIESEINLNRSVRNIFVNGDKLVIFAQTNYYGTSQNSLVQVYDISNKASPILDQEVEVAGAYRDARMIGDHIYIISSEHINVNEPELPVYLVDGIKTEVEASEIHYFDYPDSGYTFTSISAIDLDNGEFNSEVYLIGSAGNIYVSQENIFVSYTRYGDTEEYVNEIVEEVYLESLPKKQRDEIYEVMDSDKSPSKKLSEVRKIFYEYSNSLKGEERSEFDKAFYNKLQEFERDQAKKRERTVIHKIAIDNLKIDYKGVGEVPGHALNQFSMDEHEGYFRIATTTGQSWNGDSLNHLYILNSDLEIVGSVEDLAEGESVYSARFMGDKAYIVTFKKIDPLFVIDVSNPSNPEVLGYLKITGYSDYLHPYDENHLIGIGKETQGGNEDFSWYQGIKVSLFDVSDFENPIEAAKIEIGDRGTDSEALREHKAVLFDKEKGILVLPISLREINESKYPEGVSDRISGEFVWEGAYILNIGTDEISERGRITHTETVLPASEEPIGAERQDWRGRTYTKISGDMWEIEEDHAVDAYYAFKANFQIDSFPGGIGYSNPSTRIRRNLFMDDSIYTISQSTIKANNLETVEEISSLDLGYDSSDNPVYYY